MYVLPFTMFSIPIFSTKLRTNWLSVESEKPTFDVISAYNKAIVAAIIRRCLALTCFLFFLDFSLLKSAVRTKGMLLTFSLICLAVKLNSLFCSLNDKLTKKRFQKHTTLTKLQILKNVKNFVSFWILCHINKYVVSKCKAIKLSVVCLYVREADHKMFFMLFTFV